MLDSLNLEFYKNCQANIEGLQLDSHKIQPILFPDINFYTAGHNNL